MRMRGGKKKLVSKKNVFESVRVVLWNKDCLSEYRFSPSPMPLPTLRYCWMETTARVWWSWWKVWFLWSISSHYLRVLHILCSVCINKFCDNSPFPARGCLTLSNEEFLPSLVDDDLLIPSADINTRPLHSYNQKTRANEYCLANGKVGD